jgi:hypothetical protein
MLRLGGASRMLRRARGVIASSISVSHSKRSPTIFVLNGSDWFCVEISHARNTFEVSGISEVGNDFASTTSHSTSQVQPKPLGTTKSAAPDGTATEGCTRAISLASGTESTAIISRMISLRRRPLDSSKTDLRFRNSANPCSERGNASSTGRFQLP